MTILIFLSALMGGMFIGMPISFALLGAAVALMFHLDMFDAQIIAQNLINGTTSFTLMAVPFFLLAGEVMNVGGLSKRIVKVALALVGHKRGGLGYVTIIASILLLSIPPVFTLPPDSGLLHICSMPVAPREQNPGLQGNDGYNNFRHMLPGFHNTSANASRSAEQAVKAPSVWTIEARDSGG